MRSTLCLSTLAWPLMVVTARASEPAAPVQLTWNAPGGCPPVETVLGDVHRTLGKSTAHRVSARADVTEVGAEHWSVHLVTEVDGVMGERTLDANSCASLASATALILAWTVDPAAAGGERTQPAPPIAPVLDTVPPPQTPRASLRGLVAASGQLDRGMLPSTAGSVTVTLGGLWGPLRAELSGSYWLPQDARATAGGTHILLLEGSVRACWRALRGSTLELAPCFAAGVVHAASDGFGLTPTYQLTSDWGTIGGDLLGTWTMAGPFALRASIGAAVPLVRPQFVVIDAERREIPFHQANAVSGRASFGAEVRFP
jgi:hypothetical protein